MNRDKKLAIILAPFLLVGGYVISDLYVESRENETRLYPLQHSGDCRMFSADCILESGDMQVNITDRDGVTQGNTSFPVDSVAISLVYDDDQEVIYGLEQAANPQYWSRQTEIRKALTEDKTAARLRLVVTRKGSTYFSEFSPLRNTN